MDGAREQWREYFTINDVDAIASPTFCRRVKIARDLGFLDKLLLQDQEGVKSHAAELKVRILAQLSVGPRYERSP